MAKRKRAAQPAETPRHPSLDAGEARKRIRDFEDVADSDDEFHIQRDKVLLGEEPDSKRRRWQQEQEEFIQPSDEEVLDYSEPEDEDDDEDEDLDVGGVEPQYWSQGASSGPEEEGDEGEEDEGIRWGTSKAGLYGADAIETEEQALEEEAEALRLQKKQLQSMSAADYGLDEFNWQDGDAAPTARDDQNDVVTEALPKLQVTDDMGLAERLKLLKSRYPEFEPLRQELLQLQEAHATLAEQAKSNRQSNDSTYTLILTTQFRAASAYLGAVTAYFSLMTSTAFDDHNGAMPMSGTQLHDHPVMDSLVRCRELWQGAKELRAEQRSPQPADSKGSSEVRSDEATLKKDETRGLQPKRPRKSRVERHAEAAQAAAKARRAERLAQTEASLADLDALVASDARHKTNPRRAVTADQGDSDIGEEAPLTSREVEEKSKRKKSLRFYTSQIAQKVNKRGSSGRNAGGDEDVPYRERLKDRQARLNAEAERRGNRDTAAGAELGGESEDEDTRQASQIRAQADKNDYYDLVATHAAKKKSDKVALAEAQRQAALQGGRVIEEETVGPDGKRKISYAIEKNRGLTPFRKKDVRNPRVKKRQKYDEKKKKLASMKPVYKGGEGRGGYGGELTGIKKGLVKSTKLG